MAKILLIDCDAPTIARLSGDLIKQRHTIEAATHDEIGTESVVANQYDLIVFDASIARQPSLQFCQQLREQRYPNPILLLIANDWDASTGLDAGADDSVMKPYNPSELIARVRALLRRGKLSLAPTLLTWEQLRLNPTSAEVTYNHQPLALTPKEYGLLDLFLQNPQRILSRTAILDRLWTMDDVPTERAVTNHIKDLRQKLRATGMATDLIETVYGLGYRLKPAPAIDPSDQPNPPAVSDRPPAAVAIAETTPFSYPSPTALPSATVLVLDDDPTTRAALSYLLQPWGIHVVCLSQPDRLWETLITVAPALLILDIEIPFTRGIELCQQIRQDDCWGDLPILVVTASTDADRVQQMFAAGVDDFVGKPIVGPELVTRVVSRLERVYAQRTTAREPKGFELDRQNAILSSSPNLVLVDDQPDNLRTLSAILHGQGYKVRKATSGEAALETVGAQHPDLILLDIRMPAMDGYAVCAALKASEATREVPIIFLSALDDATDKLKAFAVGGADYITKPFQAEEVLARIKHQLLIRQQQRQLVEQNRQLQREIQQRQQSEMALSEASAVLQDSEERFRNAFDQVAIGMALVGLDDRWLKVNPALCQLLGYAESELLTLTVAAIVDPADLPQFTACYQTMLAGKATTNPMALRFRHPNGHLIPVQMSLSLIRSASGEPLYSIVQIYQPPTDQ
ncbi:MAG: response regulator [Lyngbya sp. HA4199-MV5]|jgi:PAS domain S-box-containing protein|nr:response regulator [Lyngbya sp. HA4199-MV5]